MCLLLHSPNTVVSVYVVWSKLTGMYLPLRKYFFESMPLIYLKPPYTSLRLLKELNITYSNHVYLSV